MIVQQGSLSVSDDALKAVELVQFERRGRVVALAADTASRILLLTGERRPGTIRDE